MLHQTINKKLFNRLSDSNIEITNQILFLENEIGSLMGELRILSEELKVIESDLEEFSTEYNKEIAPICEELLIINSIIKHTDSNPNESQTFETNDDDMNFYYVSDCEEKVLKNELKHIYRRLAKKLHPDMQKGMEHISDRLFKELTHSYMNNDIAGLMRIEEEFFESKKYSGESQIQKLERLEKRHDKLKNDIDKLKIKHNTIRNSQTYKLQQRVKWHKMCGQNLIQTIKERVKKDLDTKKAVLELSNL